MRVRPTTSIFGPLRQGDTLLKDYFEKRIKPLLGGGPANAFRCPPSSGKKGSSTTTAQRHEIAKSSSAALFFLTVPRQGVCLEQHANCKSVEERWGHNDQFVSAVCTVSPCCACSHRYMTNLYLVRDTHFDWTLKNSNP